MVKKSRKDKEIAAAAVVVVVEEAIQCLQDPKHDQNLT